MLSDKPSLSSAQWLLSSTHPQRTHLCWALRVIAAFKQESFLYTWDDTYCPNILAGEHIMALKQKKVFKIPNIDSDSLEKERQALKMAERHSRKHSLIFIQVPIKSSYIWRQSAQACFSVYSGPLDWTAHRALVPALPESQVILDKSH